MTEQDELNVATEQLARVIKRLDALAKRAGDKADALCREGKGDESADLREVEGLLRGAASGATLAYSKGRRLRVPGDGGTITPFFGGDGKG